MFNKKILITLVFAIVMSACTETPMKVVEKKLEAVAPMVKLTGEVNVYNFGEYLSEGFKPDFEKLTGLKVNYDTYDFNETLNTKLVAGQSGYDVVVPSNDWAFEQMSAGRFQKIDKSKIPNYKNLDPALMDMLKSIDPNSDYLIPWSWGYTGVGINEAKVKKALGDIPMPENPFDLVFKSEYASKLKSCGIMISDSPSNMMPLALQYLGKPTNSDVVADYDEAYKMLAKVRPYVRKFGGSADVNDIAEGNYCLFVTTAGDINMAAQRAKNPAIRPMIGHGGILFIDSMAIPADAKNVDNAHAWMNFSLDSKVAAQMTNELGYPTPALAALADVKPELASNKTIFLEPAALKSMALSPLPKTQEAKRALNDAFSRFKSGK
jgi:putrescine transport system substrate-binding protein